MKNNVRSATEEMIDILCDLFLSDGMSANDAKEKGTAVWRAISKRLGGSNIYIPTDRIETSQRDEAIYAAHVFGKLSLSAIARHEKLSKPRVWQIVRTVAGQLGTKNNLDKC